MKITNSLRITTSHSMIKPILSVCFFIMECAVITILNMILSTILLLYDFIRFGTHLYQR